MIRRTPLKRPTKPIPRNSPLKRSINALKRNPLKRKPAKRRPEDVNEDFLKWLRDTWPCFVCFKVYCNLYSLNFEATAAVPSVRRAFRDCDSHPHCGITEAAHVGVKGTGQRCPDREAMPLGRGHHRHPTDGGCPDSHHAGTRVFWEKHNLIPQEVFELLHRLYRAETGREV